MVLPWHNPVLLAEQAATLDLLSEGRLDFGIGKGYRYNEFAGFAMPMEEADERFERGLARSSSKAWTSDGRCRTTGATGVRRHRRRAADPPRNPHPPIWMGAGSPASIRPRGRARLQSAPRPVRSVRVIGERMPCSGRSARSVDAPTIRWHCPCARHACRRQPGHQGRRSRTQSPVP